MAYLSRKTLLLFMHAHFHTVSNWGKSTIFAEFFEEFNMAGKDKEHDKCIHA